MIDAGTLLWVLRHPNANLVRFLLSYASLSRAEEEILTATVIDGGEDEDLLVALHCTMEEIARHRESALRKLAKALADCPIVDFMIRH